MKSFLHKYSLPFTRRVTRLYSARSVIPLAFICSLALLRVVYETVNDETLTSPSVQDDVSFQCQLHMESSFTATLRRQLSRAVNTCPHIRRPETVDTSHTDSYWQTQQIHDDILVLYSAYYDDRPAVGVTPWIRVIGVAKLANSTHYCHIWFPGCEAPFVTPLVFNLTGRRRGYVINNVTYSQYLFSCRLPGTEPVPSHVSIVPQQCSSPSVSVPVQKPIRAEPDVEFGVCVAIAFGNIPVEVFVEWIEFGRLLGITEFNVYDAGMTNMTQVFQFYTRRRWLKVHHMPPPVPIKTLSRSRVDPRTLSRISLESVKLSSPASLNDCLLSNMYRYRYVVVIDFDELIVPRLHDNYHDMLQFIDKKYRLGQSHSTYMFRNAYFFLNFSPDSSQPQHLRSIRYQRRIQPSPFKFAPKSFVDPRSCLSVFNHYCYIPLVRPQPAFIDVSPQIALSHHYRHCEFTASKCQDYFSQQVTDNITLSFKHKVQPAVEDTLRHLHLLS